MFLSDTQERHFYSFLLSLSRENVVYDCVNNVRLPSLIIDLKKSKCNFIVNDDDDYDDDRKMKKSSFKTHCT